VSASIAYHGEEKHFSRLYAVIDGTDPANPTHAGAKVVTSAMIKVARRHGNKCYCETDPRVMLRPGLTLKQLNSLGAGCCDSDISPGKGWVCPTLGRLRRTMES